MLASDNFNNLSYLNLLSKPEEIISDIQYGIDGDLIRIYSGAPKGSVQEVHDGKTTFIHYTKNLERLNEIIEGSALNAGPVPYMFVGHGLKYTWIDLKGVFLTKPEFSPSHVGIPSSLHFVKFKLDSNVPVIKMGNVNNIWLIPGDSNLKVKIIIEGFGCINEQ